MKEGKLSDYPGMGNNAAVFIVMRLKKGSARKVDPSVARSKGPCIVSRIEYAEPVCVVMPCHHAIHPDELVAFCHNEVYDKHKWEIQCFMPRCGRNWPMSLLVKSGMTQEELNLLSKGMSTNYCRFNSDASIQKCRGCHCYCERIDKTRNDVRCTQCTRKNGKPYEFCWLCSQPCTCSHKCKVGEKLQILSNCNETTINGVKCPSIRSCPKCGTLIEHKEACKHMTCLVCQQDFCFVCLCLKGSTWPCGGYRSPCTPAPRQVVTAE